MTDVMNLYADDSGTRNPDRHPNSRLPKHGRDWFGLGGVLVREDEEDYIRSMHRDLRTKWSIDYPLHSSEIRTRSKNFRWLAFASEGDRGQFLNEVTQLVTAPPLTAVACVVDRPGYNHRYRDKYGRKRWKLCRTAFHILVERAAKFALANGCRLRVFVERSDKATDRRLQGYYEELCADGQPFDGAQSAKYEPLTPGEFRSALYEFRTKAKTSPLMQIADLSLWPICMGGYDPHCLPFQLLRKAGTLIDCKLAAADVEQLGTKYSCFELARS